MEGQSVAVTITRPANQTAYTALDVVGGAIAFPFAATRTSDIWITGVELRANVAAIPASMTTFRLHLYSVTPPSAIADNAAFDLPSGDRSSYLGYVDIPQIVDLGATLYIRTDGLRIQMRAESTSLFGYLVTTAAFTPAADSEVYVVTLHTMTAQ